MFVARNGRVDTKIGGNILEEYTELRTNDNGRRLFKTCEEFLFKILNSFIF